jgi:hypothetical protein
MGSAANYLSTILTSNGVPDNVINNFNTLGIMLVAPIMTYLLYPTLRKYHMHYGPVARIPLVSSCFSLNNRIYRTQLLRVQKRIAESTGVLSPVLMWKVLQTFRFGGRQFRTPLAVWDFWGLAIAEGMLTFIIGRTFRHTDDEEYTLSQVCDYHMTLEHTPNVVNQNSINRTTNATPEITANEGDGISQKK